MSQNSLPTDPLDGLLSDFFKSKMRQPWPTAPATAFSEPASARVAHGNRARYTLAASVAFLLGICWYFSNGTPTGDRPAPNPGSGILDKGSATMPKEFEKSKKATEPKVGLPTGPMLN